VWKVFVSLYFCVTTLGFEIFEKNQRMLQNKLFDSKRGSLLVIIVLKNRICEAGSDPKADIGIAGYVSFIPALSRRSENGIINSKGDERVI
jgi:hypothetical protein